MLYSLCLEGEVTRARTSLSQKKYKAENGTRENQDENQSPKNTLHLSPVRPSLLQMPARMTPTWSLHPILAASWAQPCPPLGGEFHKGAAHRDRPHAQSPEQGRARDGCPAKAWGARSSLGPLPSPHSCAQFSPVSSTSVQEAILKLGSRCFSENRYPTWFTVSLTSSNSNGAPPLRFGEGEAPSPGMG